MRAQSLKFKVTVFVTIALSAAINRISATVATLMFLLYSALNGVTFASIFLVYTSSSIASTFMVASGTFAAMSVYGYATRRDLTGWGSFLFMGLIGEVVVLYRLTRRGLLAGVYYLVLMTVSLVQLSGWDSSGLLLLVLLLRNLLLNLVLHLRNQLRVVARLERLARLA